MGEMDQGGAVGSGEMQGDHKRPSQSCLGVADPSLQRPTLRGPLRKTGLPSFVETTAFTAHWGRLGLSDRDLRALQLMLIADPNAGAVAAGTSGVRRLRFAAPGSGRGKSGS